LDAESGRPSPEYLLEVGIASFEAGDFAAAQLVLLDAVDRGVHDPEIISLLASLIS